MTHDYMILKRDDEYIVYAGHIVISTHATKAGAQAAVKRYEAADVRRS